MRLLALLLIAILAFGGLVDACADAHGDHGDQACVDDCCQPIYSASRSASVVAPVALCERFFCGGGRLNDDPLARSHFRPPETL